MRAKNCFVFKQQQNLGPGFDAIKMHSLGCCPFLGGCSVVVGSFFYVPPILYEGSVFGLLFVITKCPF